MKYWILIILFFILFISILYKYKQTESKDTISNSRIIIGEEFESATPYYDAFTSSGEGLYFSEHVMTTGNNDLEVSGIHVVFPVKIKPDCIYSAWVIPDKETNGKTYKVIGNEYCGE